MQHTNRSLYLAILACVAMGFWARSPQWAGGSTIASPALFLLTLVLSGAGFWWGWRGARQQRTAWSWLAPGINAFIFVAFLAFFALVLRALYRLQ